MEPKLGDILCVAQVYIVRGLPAKSTAGCYVVAIAAPLLRPVVILIWYLERAMTVPDHCTQTPNVAFREIHPRAVWYGCLLFHTL